MIMLNETEIPPLLNRLYRPPKRLYINGEENVESLLQRPRITIVGSRKVTPYGRSVTQNLTRELARAGVVIVSGLALGVDSIAHTAALEAGGQTIAVLPAGLDTIYPATHTSLATRIVAQSGALITEFPPRSIPYLSNFLKRNRIVAALSDAVLIPEAAGRSGSLNTAAYALELNMPLMAVPGNITSPLSEGTNTLIKAGAIPVTDVKDIYNALNWVLPSQENREATGRNAEEKTIISLINKGIVDGHELLNNSKLSAPVFNQTLTMLELTGRVRSLGANQWSLA